MTTVDVIKNVVGRIKSDPGLSSRLSSTAKQVEDLGLDSLEMLQFMLELEAALDVQIDFDKLEFSYLRSIDSLAQFLDTMPARGARNV